MLLIIKLCSFVVLCSVGVESLLEFPPHGCLTLSCCVVLICPCVGVGVCVCCSFIRLAKRRAVQSSKDDERSTRVSQYEQNEKDKMKKMLEG